MHAMKRNFSDRRSGKSRRRIFRFIEATTMVLIEGIDKIEDLSWKDEMAM